MSSIGPTSVKLEDGEIEEGNEPSMCTSSAGSGVDMSLPLVGEATNVERTNVHDENTAVEAAILDESESKRIEKRQITAKYCSSQTYAEVQSDFVDEDEMLYVRGASPVPLVVDRTRFCIKIPPFDNDCLMESISPKRGKTSEKKHHRKRSSPKKVKKEKRSKLPDEKHDSKVRKESSTSKETEQPSASEEGSQSPLQENLQQLCKFYLKECCAKGQHCEYMHSDFPCKFFYMGMECEDEMTTGRCKLSHGGTLPHDMLSALIRHIHTAPSDVLGKTFVDFRNSIPATEAIKKLHQMQQKLLLEEDVSEKQPELNSLAILRKKLNFLSEEQVQKIHQLRSSKSESQAKPKFISALREKLNFLSEEQIHKLHQLGFTKPEDLLYMTLGQLNAIGIRAIQIEAIQMSLAAGQDVDMRNIFPPCAVTPSSQPMVQDIDVENKEVTDDWYEFEEPPLVIDESTGVDVEDEEKHNEENDSFIDVVTCFDSPPKYIEQEEQNDDNQNERDAIIESKALAESQFEVTEQCPSDISMVAEHTGDEGSYTPPLFQEKGFIPLSAELQKYVERIYTPEPIELQKKVERSYTPSPKKLVAKINCTKHDEKMENSNPAVVESVSHIHPKKSWKCSSSPQHEKKIDVNEMQSHNSSEDWDAVEQIAEKTSKEIISISSPDNLEDEASTMITNQACPEFPQTTGVFDNYKPASEIVAHLTYPQMKYKLNEIYMPNIEVNKPPLLEKLIKSKSTDPRLKKYIEKEKNHGILPHTEYILFPPTVAQCDPRLRPGYGNNGPEPCFNSGPILYGYLQRSLWYQQQKSNIKIQINNSVSDLVRALNIFHKDSSPTKCFDLFQIECAGVLLEVMKNVGISIDVNGNINEESHYQQLCVPQQQATSHPQNNNNSGVLKLVKPGLLGYAPPGINFTTQQMELLHKENSLIRQAVCNFHAKNSGELKPHTSGIYFCTRNLKRGGLELHQGPSPKIERRF